MVWIIEKIVHFNKEVKSSKLFQTLNILGLQDVIPFQERQKKKEEEVSLVYFFE